MSKIKRTRRRVTTVALALAVFLGASFAFAAWTTNSEPWASGSTGAASHPVVTNAHIVGDLFPGDCNDVDLTVTNNNPKAVEVTGLGNTGFRNSSDPVLSESGGPKTRLEDFLTQANRSTSLNGQRLASGETKTFTIPNSVCLSAQADDARMSKTFEAGYAVAYVLDAGNEAP